MKNQINKFSKKLRSFIEIVAVILCIIAFGSNAAKAQSTCTTANTISPTLYFQVTDQSISDSVIWFSFVADSTHEWLYLTPPINWMDTPTSVLSDAKVFSGTCSSLTLLADSAISAFPANLYVSGLTIGNTYYIKITNTSISTTFFGMSLSSTLAKSSASTSGTAIVVVADSIPSNTNYQVMDSVSWFYFVADYDSMNIYFLYPSIPFDSTASFSSLSVYDNALSLISSATFNPINDTLPFITLNSLTIGNTYYFKVSTGVCGTCPIFGYYNVLLIDEKRIATPVTCTPVTCSTELLCNGNFDTSPYDWCFQYGSALTDITTTLGPSAPGKYAVCTSPTLITSYNGSWIGTAHSAPSFYIVDGPHNPLGNPVWRETITVFPNQVYAFSIWLMNLSNALAPAIDVFIGNTHILSVSQADIGTTGGIWEHYCATYNSTIGASPYISIRMPLLIGAGNDIGMDDISLKPMLPYASITSPNISCYGGNDGWATAEPVNGSWLPGGVIYSWSTSPIQTAQTAINLLPGTYTVTVTNAYGCVTSTSVTITQPSAPLSYLPTSPKSVSCFGGADGAASIHDLTGGTLPYNYSWTSSVSFSNSAFGLTAGTYTVTVTDANGCTVTESFVITQPATLLVGSILSHTDEHCNGDCNAHAIATATGGTSPYNYTWSNSQIFTATATSTATSLCAGTYTVSITDDLGKCTVTATVTITEPPPIVPTVTPIIPDCGGAGVGTAWVSSITGGSTPFSYSWSSSGQTSQTATGLSQLTVYTVTVTDASSCTGTATVTVSYDPPIIITPTIIDPCIYGNGEIDLAVTGGTGAGTYSYAWSDGTVLSNDSPLNPNDYYVTVTDGVGCTAIDGPMTIWGPILSCSMSTTGVQVICANGNGDGTASVTPDNPLFTYTWSPNTSNNSYTASSLTMGTYYVTVTEPNGCSATASGIVGYSGPVTCPTPGFGWTTGIPTLLPSGTTNWIGVTYFINQTVEVPHDATLNITASTIYFGPLGKIIVDNWNEPSLGSLGGILILNKSYLTSWGDCMWPGIEVHGDNLYGQTPPSTTFDLHGQMYMEGSTIENAEDAVYLGDTGPNYQIDQGGIIQTIGTNNTFLNNVASITFNTLGSATVPDRYKFTSASKIFGCKFTSDANTFDPCNPRPKYFISITGESGMDIGGDGTIIPTPGNINTFTLTPTYTANNTFGIISVPSLYDPNIASSWNCPPLCFTTGVTYPGSTFDGVRYGIAIQGNNYLANLNPHCISNNTFTHCEAAISDYNNNNDEIVYNNIANNYYYGPNDFLNYFSETGYYPTIGGAPNTFGIYTDLTHNLEVSYNTFNNSLSVNINSVDHAIVVNRSVITASAGPTHVWNNSIIFSVFGLSTGGQNANSNTNGISVRCNSFSGYACGWDIYDITSTDTWIPPQGICGGFTPGNSFDHTGLYDIYVESLFNIPVQYINPLACPPINNPSMNGSAYLGEFVLTTCPALDPLTSCNQIVGLFREESNIDDSINKIHTEAWLGNNRPNPFNENTDIPYFVPSNSKASMIIYDMLGQQIDKFLLEAGSNNIFSFDCSSCGYGVYLYCLEVDGKIVDRKRMVIMK